MQLSKYTRTTPSVVSSHALGCVNLSGIHSDRFYFHRNIWFPGGAFKWKHMLRNKIKITWYTERHIVLCLGLACSITNVYLAYFIKCITLCPKN